jgi:hypothetical protein
MITNEISALKKSPYMNLLPLKAKLRPEKSGALIRAEISGVRRSQEFRLTCPHPVQTASRFSCVQKRF